MPNPFFTALMGGGNATGPNPQNLMSMVQQFKANPMGFLLQKKLNIQNQNLKRQVKNQKEQYQNLLRKSL